MKALQKESTELGKRLQIAMIAAGMTQTELALKTGISQSNVSFILSGRNQTTKSDILAKMACALGVSLNWLGGDPDNSTGIVWFSCKPLSDGEGRIYFESLTRSPRIYPEEFFTQNSTVAARCKIFPVESDSMSPLLTPGDSAVVDCGDTEPWKHPSGHIYAAVTEGVFRFSRLTGVPDGVLVADAIVSPREYDRETFSKKFTVVGRVIERFGSSGF